MKTPDITFIAARLHELTADRQNYLEKSIIRRHLLTDAVEMLGSDKPVSPSKAEEWLKTAKWHLEQN